MRAIGASLLGFWLAGCAIPQYQNRLVAYPGTSPNISAAQVADICGAQARVAYSQSSAAAQAQLDARNNQVTGYNCATYGQANAYGNNAYYTGNTNCTAVTANPYGGKYGGIAAIGDAVNVVAQAEAAQTSVLTACAAQYGYRIERHCVANCRGAQTSSGTVYAAHTSSAPPSSSGTTNADLCDRAAYHPSTTMGLNAAQELERREFRCPVAGRSDGDLCDRAKYLSGTATGQDAIRELTRRGVTCAP